MTPKAHSTDNRNPTNQAKESKSIPFPQVCSERNMQHAYFFPGF